MQLVIPRETQPGENRVSATPETVKKLVRLGAEVVVETGAGVGAGFSDSDFEAAGASIGSDRAALLANADMLHQFLYRLGGRRDTIFTRLGLTGYD